MSISIPITNATPKSSLSASLQSPYLSTSPSLAPNFRISLPSMLTDSTSARVTAEDDGILSNEETSPLIGPARVYAARKSGSKVPVASQHVQAETILPTKTEVVDGPRRVRVESLDVFRGITVVFMIFVNSPGSWNNMYEGLKHATWDGAEFSDFIFPSFLFIMGNAMHMSLSAFSTPNREFYKRLSKRVVLLFLLGLILNINYDIDPSHFRIMGVLQRISLCYLIVALQVMYLPRIFQYAFNLVYITIYLALMYGVDVPGCGRGSLEPDCNAARFIDEKVFSSDHMYPYSSSCDGCDPFEPEGITGTFTSCINVFIGVLYAQMMDAQRNQEKLLKYWTVTGLTLLVIGFLVHIGMPINKNLWSISFAFVTSAASGLFLAACYFMVDLKGLKRAGWPFVVIGRNPLALYFLSGFIANALFAIDVRSDNGSAEFDDRSLYTWIYDEMFASWMPSKVASLMFAIVYTSLFVALAFILDRKKIYIRV
eukprot:TRINITY_DN218_c0_g3_i1.p1 TRINITY_DN218_c0_g3~~TRINITY_DN218_c0_g3_i1.p1  ORF type:complete len:484 (+),score=94.73 TRINITY_DN218_c0_g3_i1:210-1661(+)